MALKRIGVLTGGGDAPGLNPAIRAVAYKATELGAEAIGIYDGWQGLLDENVGESWPLDINLVRTWDRDGGTHLGSSRTNPFKCKTGEGPAVDRSAEVLRNIKQKLRLDALVPIGGEDTALDNGIKYVLVSHNTKMGAAKGAVLTAEYLVTAGYIK